ncbi:nuclear transport factor 2 family protein [Streptomyces murinus]|uniref:nuclear transport factor 2 family protein n=1 Tax=Streptomyces murinus TaxID=33900 RepID=UPI003824B9CA
MPGSASSVRHGPGGHPDVDAVFIGSGEPAEGAAAVERVLRDTVILYEDGTPRTHHVVSNLVVEVDEESGVATARSCVMVFQALPELPLQVIAAGRYEDRFERRGGRWEFEGALAGVRGAAHRDPSAPVLKAALAAAARNASSSFVALTV